MNKKVFRIIAYIIGAIITAAFVWYRLTELVINPLLKQKTMMAEIGEEIEEPVIEEQLPLSAYDGYVLPYEENTEKIGQPFPIQVENDYKNGFKDYTLQCCINKVEFTKEGVDSDAIHKLYHMGIFRPQVDKDYSILDDHSYIVVNITMTNTEETDVYFYADSFYYAPLDPETNDRFSVDGELKGYKPREDQLVYDKAYAKVELEPGEEFTCNLVYIENDENIYEKIPYLRCNLSVDECTCFVRLDE